MADDVTIRYFASLKEETGTDEETIELGEPTGLDTILAGVKERYPDVEDSLDHVAVAVNMETVQPDETTVQPGDEVALLPPFGGGTIHHG